MKNYIQNIRQKLGHDKFIHPAARIIVENEYNEVLIIEKADTGQIGIPAGAFEENETIEECIKREVWEETGLKIKDLTVIGISSDPLRESVSYPNGDQIQYFTIEFYSNDFEGTIEVQDKNEIKRALFVNIDRLVDLPENERSILNSWVYYKQYKSPLLK